MSRPRINKSVRGLHDAKETQLFRAIEDIMRDDETLSRVVKTWQSFTGQPEDVDPVTPEMCPMIRLYLFSRPITKAGETRDQVEIAVRIEAITPGTCLDDAVNLVGAIKASLWSFKAYRGHTVREWLAKYAFSGYPELPRPAGVSEDAPGVHGGFTQGRFEAFDYLPTPNITDANRPEGYRRPTMMTGVGRYVGVAFTPA